MLVVALPHVLRRAFCMWAKPLLVSEWMPQVIHFLLEAPLALLSEVLFWIRPAVWVNKKRKQSKHVFWVYTVSLIMARFFNSFRGALSR